ncbi:MAG: Kiwa anti-phage protein KwaB-like domain-containing protein [Sulfuricaulis sp.]
MLRNFHLAALLKQHGQIQLLHIPLHQALQDSLAEIWGQQLHNFTDGIEEIDFNAGYQPEIHERFRLSEFELPAPLNGVDSTNTEHHEPISQHEDAMGSIKAIVAFCRDGRGKELVLFQNFTRSHVIQPGRFLFFQNNTYESIQRPGFSLDSKLSAVYDAKDKKLLFHNFRITNTFLPLADFYEEASEEAIRQLLKHKLLAPEDTEALAVSANQWFRKRFAMLKDSGILNKYSASQIKTRSKGHDVDIHISRGKIVFPAEKQAAKKLLQFLNEEIYRGPITDTLYETNSKREAD